MFFPDLEGASDGFKEVFDQVRRRVEPVQDGLVEQVRLERVERGIHLCGRRIHAGHEYRLRGVVDEVPGLGLFDGGDLGLDPSRPSRRGASGRRWRGG